MNDSQATFITSFKLAICLVLFIGFYLPVHAQRNIREKMIDSGMASYYSNKFNGQPTATGEIFNNKHMTAASNTLPLNTFVKVTNKKNGKWVIVRINDRMHKNNARTIDLSRKAARKLRMLHHGLTKVRVEIIPKKFYRMFGLNPREPLDYSGEN